MRKFISQVFQHLFSYTAVQLVHSHWSNFKERPVCNFTICILAGYGHVVFVCLWILVLALLQSVCLVWVCYCCSLLLIHAHQYLSVCHYDQLSPGASLCVWREQGRRGEREEGKWEWVSAGTSCTLAFPSLMELTHETDTLTWHMHESLCMIEIHFILMALSTCGDKVGKITEDSFHYLFISRFFLD